MGKPPSICPGGFDNIPLKIAKQHNISVTRDNFETYYSVKPVFSETRLRRENNCDEISQSSHNFRGSIIIHNSDHNLRIQIPGLVLPLIESGNPLYMAGHIIVWVIFQYKNSGKESKGNQWGQQEPPSLALCVLMHAFRST